MPPGEGIWAGAEVAWGCCPEGRVAGFVACAETNAGIPPASSPQRVAVRSNSNMAASIRGGIEGSIDQKLEGVSELNPANIHLETTCEYSGSVRNPSLCSPSTHRYWSPIL